MKFSLYLIYFCIFVQCLLACISYTFVVCSFYNLCGMQQLVQKTFKKCVNESFALLLLRYRINSDRKPNAQHQWKYMSHSFGNKLLPYSRNLRNVSSFNNWHKNSTRRNNLYVNMCSQSWILWITFLLVIK